MKSKIYFAFQELAVEVLSAPERVRSLSDTRPILRMSRQAEHQLVEEGYCAAVLDVLDWTVVERLFVVYRQHSPHALHLGCVLVLASKALRPHERLHLLHFDASLTHSGPPLQTLSTTRRLWQIEETKDRSIVKGILGHG